MDVFVSTVKSQRFPLDGFDEVVSGIYIPCYCWFENNSLTEKSWTVFMSPEILRLSFYRTLQDFPILAGRFKTDKHSRGYVEIESSNLNMPVYTDTDWDVDFKQMRDAGFATKLLPKSFEGVCGIVAASKLAIVSAKLGIFHIRRLKNFSGVVIFASIAHAIVDAYGYFAFMSRWAELSKWTQQNVGNTTPPVPTRAFVFDRSIHASYKINNTDALDNLTLESMANGSISTRFFAWLPIDKRNLLLKYMVSSKKSICCVFHVSAQTIEALRNDTQTYAPKGMHYSINDVATALLAMVVGQANQKSRDVKLSRQSIATASQSIAEDGGGNREEDTLVAVTVNSRSRVNCTNAKDFVGNLSSPRCIFCSSKLILAEIIAENLSAVAASIRNAIAATDNDYVGQINYLINSVSDSHMRLVASYHKYKNRVTVSNVSKYNCYGLDFGTGAPSVVRPVLSVALNSIFVMPGHPDVGGYDFVVFAEERVSELIVQNRYWMNLVDSFNLEV
ncbi:hypothetical protein H4217_004607 [Coemansia sp. RSA 1939]|nr:hypothetical protein H4217_004607 [Coemansia sp. RSA 1939]